MAHGKLAKGEYFFWNISSDVGVGKPNSLDDVELVRFGFSCWSLWPSDFNALKPDFKQAIHALRWQGGFDQDLQLVIDLNQKYYGGKQDRCISVAKSGIDKNLEYQKGQYWTIWILNAYMRFGLPSLYPRIDMDSRSGPAITETVRGSFISTSWNAANNPNF